MSLLVSLYGPHEHHELSQRVICEQHPTGFCRICYTLFNQIRTFYIHAVFFRGCRLKKQSLHVQNPCQILIKLLAKCSTSPTSMVDGSRWAFPCPVRDQKKNIIKQLDVGVSPPAFSFTLIVTLTSWPLTMTLFTFDLLTHQCTLIMTLTFDPALWPWPLVTIDLAPFDL